MNARYANYPVLPVAAAVLMRAAVTVAGQFTAGCKALARARKNRRAAHVLAGLENHMLADIGITRADLNDAFSGPVWEDPTALLKERVMERRGNRAQRRVIIENGFHRPPLDRPSRQAI